MRAATKTVLALAKKHFNAPALCSPVRTSAALALADAEGLIEAGFEEMAKRKALKSLSHSVGAEHADYRRADAIVRGKRV